MRDYHLVALDLDGTIARPDDTVSERTLSAIAEAQRRGVTIALATSRRWIGAEPIARVADLRGYIIAYDGAFRGKYAGSVAIESADSSEEARAPLDVEVARSAAEIVGKFGLQVVAQYVNPDGEWLVASERPRHPEWMASYLDRSRTPVARVPLAGIAGMFPSPLRLVSFGPMELLRRAFAALDGLPVGRQILPMGNYGSSELTIFAPGVSKGSALRTLAAHLGIPIEATMAIGDGINDIPMLREVGLGVAIGGSAPEVQAAADLVTAAFDEDGAARAIERYALGWDTDVAAPQPEGETA